MSDLLLAPVFDAAGRDLGQVLDVRLAERRGTFEVVGVDVGRGLWARLAHAWGYAAGRASGPWILRAVSARALRHVVFIRAEDVASWSANRVQLAK
jgi:hypothetical protein